MAKTLPGSGILNSILGAIHYNTSIKLPNVVRQGTRIVTLEEVSCHDTVTDCWIVIYDRVYDITDFLDEHPGGTDILLEYAGRDGSVAFRGSGHTQQALKLLDNFIIGELPIEERIFRKVGGFKLSGIPD